MAVYDEEDEIERLSAIVKRWYLRMLRGVHEVIGQALGIDDFVLDDAATRRTLFEAATRVVRISETTRQAIAEMLERGQALGLSTTEIANGVPDIGYRGIDGLYRETWNGRAQAIARTELQHAQVESSLNRYQASDLVDRVRIIDGTDYDDACAARNGKIVPLTERPGLLHPNCTLVLVPVLRE